MKTPIFVCLLAAVVLFPVLGLAASQFGDGEIDSDLRFEGFDIRDGFLAGSIVNTSNRMRPAVKLDIWTTNLQETRIFWRKTYSFGDMAPGARVQVREPYRLDDEKPSRIKFMFRVPTKANFRN